MTLACRYHPTCPGCALLPLPYPRQLEQKQQRLAAALDRYPHLDLPKPAPIVGAERTEGYRHRLKLPVHSDRDGVRIGLYGTNHRVLDTPDCPVLAEPLRVGLAAIRDWLRGRSGVHSVDLRVSAATGELQLVMACPGGVFPGGPRAARELRRQMPALASVAVSRSDPEGKRVMGSAPEGVAGAHWIEERIGATEYRLHPGAFFQVDPVQAQKIHALVRDGVGEAPSVLDLYAGVGAYGLMLAPGRSRVVLVEEVPQAAAAAREVAPRNVSVVTSKVEDLDLDDPFDAAVLNPARRGADPATLRRVARLAGRLVYVSCGPETLARDLDVLAAFGMRATRIVPVDLFPQTPEVETVVVLERGPKLERWGPRRAVQGPWGGRASGATGRPSRVLALVVGDVRPHGEVDGARFERIGTVATHSLLRLSVRGSLTRVLARLNAWGHPVAGEDPRTRRFFAEKAGLLRPFIHVERDADGVEAPLHGDLAEALAQLGGTEGTRTSKRPTKRRPKRR